jgi:hypothetical protein
VALKRRKFNRTEGREERSYMSGFLHAAGDKEQNEVEEY